MKSERSITTIFDTGDDPVTRKRWIFIYALVALYTVVIIGVMALFSAAFAS